VPEHTPRSPAPATPADPVAAAVVAPPPRTGGLLRTLGLMVLGALLAVGAMWVLSRRQTATGLHQSERPGARAMQPAAPPGTTPDTPTVRLTEPQMQRITLATVSLQPFRDEKVATGKIAFHEELLTPVFAAYAGRVTRVMAKPGDTVQSGAPLLELYTP